MTSATHNGPVHAGGAPASCRLCKSLSDAATLASVRRYAAKLKGVS